MKDKRFKEGERVVCPIHGRGIVRSVAPNPDMVLPVTVKFDTGAMHQYTRAGSITLGVFPTLRRAGFRTNIAHGFKVMIGRAL